MAVRSGSSNVNKLLQAEDFDQNPFFNALRHFHPNLYNQTAQKRWVVVVPHSKTLGKATLDEDFLQTHLLMSSPYFKEEFITVNGKCVTCKGNAIVTKSGFSGLSRKAVVLHEELFYNEDFQSFRVLLVDKPLIGEISEPMPPSDQKTIVLSMKIEDRALLDHVDLIRMSLAQNPRGVGELLKNLNAFTREFRNLVLVKGFSKYAADKVQNAITTELQTAINSPQVDEISDDLEMELHVAVESFVMAALHEKIFLDLCKNYETEDHDFIELLHSLHSTTMDDLGIQRDFQCFPKEALQQLREINKPKYNTPILKLKCLKKVTSLISQAVDRHIRRKNTSKELALATDDLLPLMVFVVIRAIPVNINANIQYIEYFHKTNMATTELGFHFANFKAAYKYISEELAKPRYRGTPPSPSMFSKKNIHPSLSLNGRSSRYNSSSSSTTNGEGKGRYRSDQEERKNPFTRSSSARSFGRNFPTSSSRGDQPVAPKTKGSLMDSLITSEPLFTPRQKPPVAHANPKELFEDTKKSKHEPQFTPRPPRTTDPVKPSTNSGVQASKFSSFPPRHGQSVFELKRSVTAPEVIRIDNKEHPLSDELGSFLSNLRKNDDIVTGTRRD